MMIVMIDVAGPPFRRRHLRRPGRGPALAPSAIMPVPVTIANVTVDFIATPKGRRPATATAGAWAGGPTPEVLGSQEGDTQGRMGGPWGFAIGTLGEC